MQSMLPAATLAAGPMQKSVRVGFNACTIQQGGCRAATEHQSIRACVAVQFTS